MENFEKRIQFNDNRILIYKVCEDYAKSTITITEGFLENGNLKKTYSLSQWDDYGFNGWVSDDKGINKLSFDFDINHPLFWPLFHLLNYDEELLIDDDGSLDDNKKYMLVYRKDNKIFIDFIDCYSNDLLGERFNVFIKNILTDARSKIDQKNLDTKNRLTIFFNEVNDVLMNDYHQCTFEEYLLRINTRDEEMKKVFKRYDI